MAVPLSRTEMQFRRIHDLPPYVFATVDALKRDLRREGRDVIDLGFGNPDIPSPDVAVEKLREAALNPRHPPTPTVTPQPRHRAAATRRRRALRERLRRRARPRHADLLDDRREGRA